MVVLDTFKKIHGGKYEIQHDLNTRNRDMLRPKFHRLTRSQQSLTYNGPNEWNSLPNDLRCITSIRNFKHKVKNYLLQKY